VSAVDLRTILQDVPYLEGQPSSEKTNQESERKEKYIGLLDLPE